MRCRRGSCSPEARSMNEIAAVPISNHRWAAGGNSCVPHWVYSDPGVYALEQERIFRGPTWSYVALEAELPNPGDFKTTYVGEAPVVVVRDREGDVGVLLNRCAH